MKNMKTKTPLNIDDLSIEQKIGQMLLMRNPIDQEDFDFVMEMIQNHSLGGIHISSSYVKKGGYIESEKVILDEVLRVADYPILICENMEDGYFDSEVSMPNQMALGSANSEELCYEYGKITAIEAKRAGYNTVFGPIVDIAMNPDASCVGARAFGGNKELVAKMSAAVIRGYQDQGMVVTAKHFPGFGASPVDSHIGMVYLDSDAKELLEREIYPYSYCTENANLSGVMVGHIMVPKVDPVYPASLSKPLVDLLRSTGYDGLIMTDSFAMIGLTNLFGLKQCHQLAMQAGMDMVMTSYRISAREAYGYMMEAYREGMVTEEQITSAARRVIAAQNRTMQDATQTVITQKEKDAVENMAKSAISVSLNGVDSVALDTSKKHLFIVQEGNIFREPSTGDIRAEVSDLAEAVRVLKEKFVNSDFITLPEFPPRFQIEDVMALTMQYDSVVMLLMNQNEAYMGSADATKRMISVLAGLRPKLSAVMQFGCPYAAREYGEVKRIIFGYNGKQCQKFAALALAGELTPTGTLPVQF